MLKVETHLPLTWFIVCQKGLQRNLSSLKPSCRKFRGNSKQERRRRILGHKLIRLNSVLVSRVIGVRCTEVYVYLILHQCSQRMLENGHSKDISPAVNRLENTCFHLGIFECSVQEVEILQEVGERSLSSSPNQGKWTGRGSKILMYSFW